MSEQKQDVVGHITHADGSHTPLTRNVADAIKAEAEQADARRKTAMPTTQDALATMMDAYIRLSDLGWRRGQYCPKDGTSFAVIEIGSTGIFTGFYCGKWPDGYCIVEDDIADPKSILFKPLILLTEQEESKRQASAESTRQFVDRLGRSLAHSGDDEEAT